MARLVMDTVRCLCLGKLLSPIGAVIGLVLAVLPAGFLALVVGAVLGGGWAGSLAESLGVKPGGVLEVAASSFGVAMGFVIVFWLVALVGTNVGNYVGYLLSLAVQRIKVTLKPYAKS